jgi:hypothetical protein
MRYPYRCPCGNEFDVIKRLADIDKAESCPICGIECDSSHRIIARSYFYGTEVEDEMFDPAFGMIIKSKKHRRSIAKQRGWEEVGNENPDKIYEKNERDRQEKHKRSWEFLNDRIEIRSRA